MTASKQPELTVVLSAFNAAETIGPCVESLLQQTFTDFYLYIVNDASTDGTLDVAKEFVVQDSRVRLIDLKKNIGTWAAKNLVLKNFATGSYLAHQDADDLSKPTRFEKQIVFLRDADKSVAGCGTAIDEFFKNPEDRPDIPSDHQTQLDPDGFFHRKNHYEKLFAKGSHFEHSIDDLAKLKIAMNGSIIFKIDVLRDLGGYDGTTPVAGDTDLLWRLLTQYSFANIQDVLYARRFHKLSLTKSTDFGFRSNVRVEYMIKAKQRLQKQKELYEKGLFEDLRQSVKRDFYYPDVNFKLYE